jgi:pimeloyl-ACP methyl ester carboxylesterase
MTQRKPSLLLFAVAIASFCLGGLSVKFYPPIKSYLTAQMNRQDDLTTTKWPDAFSVVQIRSSADGSLQPAYVFAAPPGVAKPLLVSLHTWSGNYAQNDPLAEMARNEGWNYIHPDFRGPNHTKEACLSKKGISDIDDAIQYAIDNGSVDVGNIFVVGASGGGYATLGAYLKSYHRVKAFLSWVPISDLISWFHQSKSRHTEYAEDILHCTSDGMSLDENEARLRSPIFWDMPTTPKGRLEIYAGINDGYTGSVPISHSVLFFNRLVENYGYAESRVDASDLVKLLTRGMEMESGEHLKQCFLRF